MERRIQRPGRSRGQGPFGSPIEPGPEPRLFDSRVEARFAREFVRATSEWSLTREPEPIEVAGALVFPDFEIRATADPSRRWLIEIVGFWTAAYLEKKFAVLRVVRKERLVLCVDRARACELGALPEVSIEEMAELPASGASPVAPRRGRTSATLTLAERVGALDNCTYCPKLCRFSCPVSVADGNEALLPRQLMLSANLEAWALISTLQQNDLVVEPGEFVAKEEPSLTPHIPMEWMLSVRTANMLDGRFRMSLGGGSFIPTGENLPVTTPAFRLALGLHYIYDYAAEAKDD